ncbi:hypothetical protein BD779DRAFT_1669044 [Infundibulicybe gibba]|nr:hypothetical protein BD779DRAFT_1669044 [Infundibulicybe gibba]
MLFNPNRSARLWFLFKKVRVVLFAICTILSLAWTIFLAVLLLREWHAYDGSQRAIMIVLVSINGISAILLYLMIVVHFRIWLDAARISCLLIFQVGGTVTFALASPAFPCQNLGSQPLCRQLSSAYVVIGWVFSGFLLFYAFILAFISHVPRPVRSNPEAALIVDVEKSTPSTGHSPASSTDSRSWLLNRDEKRLSHAGSDYSETSWIGSYLAPSRSASIASRQTTFSHGNRSLIYRPDTPGSIYSATASSVRGMRSPYDPYFMGRPGPQSPWPQPHPHQTRDHNSLFPNPFADPVQRYGSPMSVYSGRSTKSEGIGYGYGYGYGHGPRSAKSMLTRPERALSLTFSSKGGNHMPPPPYMDRPQLASSANPFTDPAHIPPGTPLSLRPAVQMNSAQDSPTSPGTRSIHSMAATIFSRAPSRAESRFSPPPPVPPLPTASRGLPSSPRSQHGDPCQSRSPLPCILPP